MLIIDGFELLGDEPAMAMIEADDRRIDGDRWNQLAEMALNRKHLSHLLHCRTEYRTVQSLVGADLSALHESTLENQKP
ncbi:MAG: hypothetical protein AAFQ57_14775, partial [Cyanobacteria bacterium J06626_14]